MRGKRDKNPKSDKQILYPRYVRYRPNQVWTALGWAVERDNPGAVREILKRGGLDLLDEAFTLDDGPITPLQHARNKAPNALEVILEFQRKA